MQIVEIPRENGEYEKDGGSIDLFIATDSATVATLFQIHKAETLEAFTENQNITKKI